MSEDTSPDVETEDTSTEDQDTSPETQDSEPDTVSRAELDRVIKARDTSKTKLRELQAKIKELEAGKDAPAEPDPVDKANARIVKSATRTALAGAGITDKDVQAVIVKHLDLSGVEVDEDGEPDEDAIEEIVSALRKAFESKGARSARQVSTRPAGSVKDTGDPDSARYRKFLTGQR